MSTRLDREYPPGNPDALYCRHCQCRRLVGPNGGLFCRECDGGAWKTAVANEATS